MVSKISCILTILLSFLITFSNCQTFESFKLEMQKKALQIANGISQAYSKRCTSSLSNCLFKSYDICQGTAQKICMPQFLKPGGCVDSGAYLANHSGIRFPNNIDPNNLSQEQAIFVCSSASNQMQAIFNRINTQSKRRFTYVYFGNSLGAFRIFPSNMQSKDQTGTCGNYDPRIRPWYVTGSSGGKNVIILIDISGSMDGIRLTLAKQASKAVIRTLSNNDFVGVLTFANQATALDGDKVQRATGDKKDRLRDAVDNLQAYGDSNYQVAFRRGFQMLTKMQPDQYGSQCASAQNVFLFITDGQPTIGQQTHAGLKSIIDSLNSQYQITLFTYAMGSNNIDLSIIQQLACDYKGISFNIPTTGSDSQLLTQMRGYYNYLSKGISVTQPAWTQPYQDAFGFGRLVTVSMPSYYQQNGTRIVLGVSGVDVTMSQMQSFGLTQSQIVKKLLAGAPCYSVNLTTCDIQNLRDIKCGITCSPPNQTQTCSKNFARIFDDPVAIDEYICCGLTQSALAGIVVGTGVGSIIIIIVLGCLIKRCMSQHKQIENQLSQGHFKSHEISIQ